MPAALLLVAAASLIAGALLSPAPATANQCAQQCQAQHNQCRIQTKGSPSCDAALTQCLAACRGKS